MLAAWPYTELKDAPSLEQSLLLVSGAGFGHGSGAQQEGSARRGRSQHRVHVLTYVLFSA